MSMAWQSVGGPSRLGAAAGAGAGATFIAPAKTADKSRFSMAGSPEEGGGGVPPAGPPGLTGESRRPPRASESLESARLPAAPERHDQEPALAPQAGPAQEPPPRRGRRTTRRPQRPAGPGGPRRRTRW